MKQLTMDNGKLTIKNMLNEKGQVIMVLILVMTVALAIGLSMVQKSLVDVSTSTRVEESSRAFSAAEAGIEKALKGDYSGVNFTENNSSATIPDTGLIPAIPTSGTQDPLEYPPLAEDEVAHVWLADPDADLPNCTKGGNPATCYTQNSLNVYWGDPTSSDKAALELTLVYYNGTQYVSRKWYLDNPNANRTTPNNFNTEADCSAQCKFIIGGINSGVQDPSLPSAPSKLMLIRARLLYNDTSSQPFAVQAVGTGAGHYIPLQARILTSIGTSGDTQRKVRVFRLEKVVPPYFDYAIFSAGAINK